MSFYVEEAKNQLVSLINLPALHMEGRISSGESLGYVICIRSLIGLFNIQTRLTSEYM